MKMRITNINMKKIAQFITERDIFLVTAHQRPDGDALGSGLALVYMLQSLGKYSFFLLDDTLPENYSFLPYGNEIKGPKEFQKASHTNIVVLDSSNLHRVGAAQEIFAPDCQIVNIDHHPDNERFGHINWVEEEMAATGEMIYTLANYLKIRFDEHLATLIAVALITDTGGFKYSNTTPSTHRTMASLMEAGANTSAIMDAVYGNYTFQQLQFLSLALQEVKRNEAGSLAWCILDQDLFQQTGIRPEESRELVGYPRSIEGVEAAVLFTEVEPGLIRVTMRSNGSLAVNKVASLFGGGGHHRAAGCVLEQDLETTKEQVITALERELSRQDDGNNQSS